MKTFKKLCLSVALTMALTSCVNTADMNNEAAKSYMGVVQQAKSQGAVDTNSKTAKRIHAVFNKMKPYADKANTTGVPFNWEITVVKSDEMNAWAMPGGKMMFYTGLVEKLGLNDDEIATVMGHEMAHALKEHGKTDKTFSSITDVAVAVGKTALETKGVSTNVMGFDAVDVLREYGLDKPFSRSQETEADEAGLMLMAKAGYNPKAAPKLWDKMKKASGGSQGVLAALASTHPSDEDRQANLERLMPEALTVYQGSKK